MKYDWLFVLVTRGNRWRILRARVNLYIKTNENR